MKLDFFFISSSLLLDTICNLITDPRCLLSTSLSTTGDKHNLRTEPLNALVESVESVLVMKEELASVGESVAGSALFTVDASLDTNERVESLELVLPSSARHRKQT